MGKTIQHLMSLTALTVLTSACIPILQNPGSSSGGNSISSLPTGAGTYDGSANAPAGTAQEASLLTSYSLRASWKVAGVDYAVGIPNAITLKNPSTINMPGVTINASTKLIQIQDQSNVIFDGYDFTGYQLSFINSPYGTIRNCNFALSGAGQVAVAADSQSQSLYIGDSAFDGGGVSGALISQLGPTAIIEYNSFSNSGSDVLDLFGGGSLLFQFNLIENAGIAQSGFYLRLADAIYSNIQVTGNTALQSTTTVANQVGTVGFVIDPGNGSVAAANVQGNTMVAVGPTASVTPVVDFIGVNPANVTTATISSNYFDPTSATNIFESFATATNIQYSQNYNMVTGQSLP